MNKLLYIDIVKKNLNNIVIEKKIIKQNINLSTRINILLNKLLKNDKYKIVKKKIHNIINSKNDVLNKILEIHKILITYNIPNIQEENKNHYWISQKLIEIIKKYNYSNDICIADIGGGNGNILNYINNNYDVPSDNLYIIEQKEEWDEKYKYSNKLNYIFWDNNHIDIKDNSLDIIIIMVSLHHMIDITIDNLLINIKRILKHNGLIIIKEHNCCSEQDKLIIDWEHHLYHLLLSNDINEDNTKIYLSRFNIILKYLLDYMFL